MVEKQQFIYCIKNNILIHTTSSLSCSIHHTWQVGNYYQRKRVLTS